MRYDNKTLVVVVAIWAVSMLAPLALVFAMNNTPEPSCLQERNSCNYDDLI